MSKGIHPINIKGKRLFLLNRHDTVSGELDRLTTRLALAEKVRDEWKRSSELVARVLIDTKAALTALEKPNPPKGRFLPDIEDLSHTIDFEEPKCGTCDESGEVETVRGKHHKLIGSKPCPDCEEAKDDTPD